MGHAGIKACAGGAQDYGANDFGSTMIEENVVKAAGVTTEYRKKTLSRRYRVPDSKLHSGIPITNLYGISKVLYVIADPGLIGRGNLSL